ncbi:MAG: hypothetical protein JJU28_04455 [Cyclobacteriaceae bacterium]|nr:hypothetical protein [Cyclobacteriaceae bacterium]
MITKQKLTLALISLLFFASCEQSENTLDEVKTPDIIEAEYETIVSAIFDDIDEIVFEGMELSGTSERTSDEELDQESPLRCATRTVYRERKAVVIDFGDGCEDPSGKVRKGKIIIQYSEWLFVPGATVTVTFNNYFVNGVKVEGTRTRKNISQSEGEGFVVEITLRGGKLIWPDRTIHTRESKMTRKRIRGEHPGRDLIYVDGWANGVNRNEIRYAVSIPQTIMYRRFCEGGRVFTPVKGEKVFRLEGQEPLIINYGDGSCSEEILVTRGTNRALVNRERLRNWMKHKFFEKS